MHKTGETVTVQFRVCDPETSGLVDADAPPTGTLIVNGVDNAAAVTITNLATGKYRAAVTLPEITDGDELQLAIGATVGGVAGGGIVWSGEGVTKRPADVRTDVLAAVAALAVVPLAAGGSAPAAGTLTIRRGDTVTLTVAGLAAQLPAGETWADVLQIWWGGKKAKSDLDVDALAIVEDTDGLLVCAGIAAADLDAEQTGTITVTDSVDGDIAIALSEAATAALPDRRTAYWDVQVRTASGVYTLAAGNLVIAADVVRAVE